MSCTVRFGISADELRGSVDGWDFKSYVLGTMFYRYISENLASYINAGEIDAGDKDFDYAKLPDSVAEEIRDEMINSKGFFILPSELFCNVRQRAAQDENLNETLEKVFTHIEESAKGSFSEASFAGLFDDFDVNSNKLGATVAKRNEKLCKLLNGIGEMKLGEFKDNQIDAFGDALRVPDDHVRLQRRQERRRVLHAQRGVRAAGAAGYGGQDAGE